MTYTLVQSLGQDETLALDGHTYTVPAIVEDDEGLRWLLTNSAVIRAATYVKAVANGIVALLCPLSSGGGWEATTVERFMETRDERGSDYVGSDWPSFDRLPSYFDLTGAEDQPLTITVRAGEPGTGMRLGDVAAASEKYDPAGKHFCHLHTHSEFSPLDGLSTVPAIVDTVKGLGQRAVAVTDHGVCSSHPQLSDVALKAGIKPIFGLEAYVVDDRLRRPVEWWVDETGRRVSDEVVEATPKTKRSTLFKRETDQKEVAWGYYHLTLIAVDQVGLKNLWGASTASQREEAKYYNPRMDWEVLRQHSEGIIALSGCLRGPIAKPIADGNEEKALENLARLLDIFDDRLYLEVMPNDIPEQIKVNQALAAYAEEFNIPLVATVDSHYPHKEDYHPHQVWVRSNSGKEIGDDSDLFSHDLGLYLQSEQEVRAGLGYLTPEQVDQAIWNTGRIADLCTAEIPISTARPIFSKKGGMARDEERLLDLCMENWHLTEGKRFDQDTYIARFEREFALLVQKGFCGYFLQVADYVSAMKAEGCLVGPGRGSGGGSLVAYLSLITSLDPVDGELLFERFMTEGREALPDFDVDFPTSWRPRVTEYITNRYGEDHVVRVGTHLRLKNKGIFKSLFSTLKEGLPETYWRDADAISKIIGDAEAGTAGLGLKYDELMASEEEVLRPYMEKYPEIFTLAERMVGILKSYGQHPAGLVVADDVLTDALPLRQGEDGGMITQFDMNALELMGYIKFDILTLRTLDSIQQTVDLIEANRGHRVNVYGWTEEYSDPQVWETFGDGHTLGIFQVETASGVTMCKRMDPHNLNELADTITLVRPGPKRSGLTDLYIDRRNGDQEVDFPDARMEEALSKTYGCLLYQEDIMQTCMILGGYDSNEADEVRKILGKKKVEKVLVAGQEFVARSVPMGMDRGASEHLWDQMAEFAKYSFNRAHAYGYSVLAYWTAWLKVHYPVDFFTAILSTVKEDRIPEFVNEARRMGFSILPPDVNESRKQFSCQGLNVRYGIKALPGIADATADPLLAGQPYSSFEDFRERSGVNSGVVSTLSRIGAFDSMIPNRRGLDTMLAMEKSGDADRCIFVTEEPNPEHPWNLACGFDWSSEEPEVNPRTGKIKAVQKPPPKRCTRACRQYSKPEPIDISKVEPYTDADIRNIEMEILGIHLSSTVWDTLDPDERADYVWAADQIQDGPSGTYPLAVTITKIKKHIDKSGNEMCFLGLNTERGELDCTVFAKTWVKYREHVSVGDLCLVEVVKNGNGINLAYLASN